MFWLNLRILVNQKNNNLPALNGKRLFWQQRLHFRRS